ncbi:hypothetical protein HMPREF2533_01625 [Bacteroides fragilis]|nr:hypothetical protein HMPREF2530_01625 [Bacteroides fragilis]KXU47371.1 hypothetical protein HMPREF2533_01625 [Bacteroides fragilis]
MFHSSYSLFLVYKSSLNINCVNSRITESISLQKTSKETLQNNPRDDMLYSFCISLPILTSF